MKSGANENWQRQEMINHCLLTTSNWEKTDDNMTSLSSSILCRESQRLIVKLKTSKEFKCKTSPTGETSRRYRKPRLTPQLVGLQTPQKRAGTLPPCAMKPFLAPPH